MFKHYYAADFENTTGGNDTYVYGAGLASVESYTPCEIFDTLDDFMRRMNSIPTKSVIYFHNFANYDGKIIIDWLLHHGYQYTTDTKVKLRFSGIITDDNQIYQLKVRFNRVTVEFRDTCKLIMGTLDKIGRDFKCQTTKLVGTVDYDKPQYGHVMDATERAYLEHDVLLLKEIILKIMQMGNLINFLTAGSYAFSELKDSLYQSRHGWTDAQMAAKRMSQYYKKDIQDFYRMVFPELDAATDRELRRAYRGGYCINWSDGEVYDGHGIVLDFNSLYPSVMVGKPYPYGRPKVYQGYIPSGYDTYIVHIQSRFDVKDGCLPFIQVKNNPRYVENVYLRTSKFEKDGKTYDEDLDIWLTSVDYQLFHDMYNVRSEQIEECYCFHSDTDLFDHFVTKHYEAKKNATDKTTRQAAKIVLNSSYGKFGTRTWRQKAIPYINDKGTVSYKMVDDTHQRESITYIPVACFVTAYGREKTLRSAMKVIDHLRYIDTDSLHLVDITLDEVKNIFDIDDKELGFLACESEFDKGRWVRQKTYIERNIIEDGHVITDKETGAPAPKINVKACGLTADGKKQFLSGKYRSRGKEVTLSGHDEIFRAFTYGLQMENAKLAKHTVRGGCNLHYLPFEICE